MNIKSEIKYIISNEATTMKDVAKRLMSEKGINLTANNFSRKLRQNTIKFSEVDAIADLLGYDIKFEKRK